MPIRPKALIDRYASARMILLSLAASIACGVLPLSYALHRIRAHSPDAAPLDMSPGYTPDEAYAMIARYGDDVRSFYIFNAFTADLIGPLLFNLTLALLITACFRRLGSTQSPWLGAALVVPLAAFVLDMVENSLLSIVVARFPERADRLASVASLATQAKRVAVFGTWGLTAALAIAATVAILRSRGAARGDSPPSAEGSASPKR